MSARLNLSSEERKWYYKNYRKDYYLKKKERRKELNSNIEGYTINSFEMPMIINFEPIDEKTLRIKEKRCQWNRCNKVLNMTEKLFGNNCRLHSIGQTPNVNNLNKIYK